jgi:hypothetical protein
VCNIFEVGFGLTAEEIAMVCDIGPTGTDSEGGGVVNRRSLGGNGLSTAPSWKRTNVSMSRRVALNEMNEKLKGVKHARTDNRDAAAEVLTNLQLASNVGNTDGCWVKENLIACCE